MKTRTRVLGILFAVALISPLAVSAQTTDISAQVQSLLSQISALQQQLKTLLASQQASSSMEGSMQWAPASSTGMMMPGMVGSSTPCAAFARNLSVGDSGGDVTALQQMLSAGGFLSASSTGFFGPLTAHALALFQMRNGVASSSANGFFGPITRGIIGRRCGGENHPGMMMMMGSTTPPMPMMMEAHASTTLPWMPMRPASSTQPCATNENQGGAAALFVPHVVMPGMWGGPCGHQNPPPSAMMESSSSATVQTPSY